MASLELTAGFHVITPAAENRTFDQSILTAIA
jgi:hypothetical protein